MFDQGSNGNYLAKSISTLSHQSMASPKNCFHRELPQAPNYKSSGHESLRDFFAMPMFYICVGEICSFVVKRTCFALFEQKTTYLMVVDILRG